MEVKLDTAGMQMLVEKAIFDGLTPEKREDLLRGAIQALMARTSSSSYNSPTVLQQTFNDAARRVAEKIATDHLETDPEFQTNVKKLFADVAEKLFTGGESYEKLTEMMAQTIRSALTRDRY